MYPIPSDAVVGSTDERRNAWNSLSEAEKSDTNDQFQSILNDAMAQTPPGSSPVNTNLSFVNGAGYFADGSANATRIYTVSFGPDRSVSPAQPCNSCNEDSPPPPVDADIDGLPDSFETNLADGFTPSYHVSGGEQEGTGFATFNNSVPETVNQVFGATPPISYFRVTPLRLQYGNDGIPYGLIQIDYFTLWNRDDGLVSGGLCIVPFIVNQLGSHPLDNERSAILVAAPIVNGTYDLNPQAYKVYNLYTAAHEDTFFDHSYFFNIIPARDFNNHILLGLSRSKHSTYVYNPNNHPLFPQYVINATYSSIYLDYYYYHRISYLTYLSYLLLADQLFYECVIEKFQDQGGTYANTRINIGEANNPINNAGFIRDPAISDKFNFHF